MTTHPPPAFPAGYVPWPPAAVERYRALGLWRDETFAEAFDRLARDRPNALAVVDGSHRFTHAQLATRARQLAAGLARLDIGRGDAVIVQLPGGAPLLEVCLALFRLGACPVMAQPAHRRLEITQFAARSRAVAHVIPARHGGFDFRPMALEVRGASDPLRHTLVVGEPGPHLSLHAQRCADAPDPVTPVSPQDVALYQLSGGSTSVPKLIARSHADYLYSVRQSVRVCGFAEDTVYLAALPAAHNFPLSSPGVLGALLASGRVVFSPSPAPRDLFRCIAREGVTVTALVPALLRGWLQTASQHKGELTSLHTLQVGGAKLDPATAQRVQSELGCQLQQVFGMAEGLVCYTRAQDDLHAVQHTQGRPMSEHDEIRIVDDADAPVAPGEVGHLCTRGPYTVRGYFDAPDHDAVAFTADGFYRTGDLVRQTPSGHLVVEGRAKDQINRGGDKIAAPEVEALLCAHPDVDLAALVPAPDVFLGERSCAFVVLARPVAETALRAHLRERGLASYKIPDLFEPVDGLPTTAVGKVDKRALAARLQPPGAVGSAATASKEAAL